MAGRLIGLSFLAALGFLLLFGSESPAAATTIKTQYYTYLSCAGTDGVFNRQDCDLNNDGDCADAGELAKCANNLDDDGDTLINDGCPVVGDVEAVCNEKACPDANSAAPWDTCDDDPVKDGFINDGCTGGDDSCARDLDPTTGAFRYGAYGANLTADMISHFEIPVKNPALPHTYSNFAHLATMGIPSTWKIATAKEIPLGALIGTMTATSTLGLFGGACTTSMVVTLNMFNCSTANFEGVNDGCPKVGIAECDLNADGDCADPGEAAASACNDSQDNDIDGTVNDGCPQVGASKETVGPPNQCTNAIDDDGDADPIIVWDAALDGNNLTYGQKGGLPKGCSMYPKHLNDMLKGVRPRARYFGFSTVIAGMAPTKLNFLIFSPEQLTELPLPEADMIDELGYINFVVLDDPDIPAPGGSALEEFCTPLATDTNLHGKTDGRGELIQDVPPVPAPAGTFWRVLDFCYDNLDNNGDTSVNEMCQIQRVKNPAANKGLWGTGTHLAGAYAESNRDADGDTVPNNEDECALQYDLFAGGVPTDPDGDFMNSACDPTPNGANADPDADGWSNQQDNCPLVNQANQNDSDGDFIGDACDNNNWDGTNAAGSPSDKIWGLNGPFGTPPLTLVPYVTAEAACNDNLNNDTPTPDESMWDEGCVLNVDFPNGRYVNDMPMDAVCIGALDTDGDGWCDATEDHIGPGGVAISVKSRTGEKAGEREVHSSMTQLKYCVDGLDNDSDTYVDAADAGCSVPETRELDYAVTSLEPLSLAPEGGGPGDAPRTCTNYSYYDVRLPLNAVANVNGRGGMVDDDADTLANAADTNCVCDTGTDADCDGKPDAGAAGVADNCYNVWNPTQLDTDSDCGSLAGPTLSCGDACDTDDDADGLYDTDEWKAGSDPKNVCDPRNFDLKVSNSINILDVSTYASAIKTVGSPPAARACFPPLNYSICQTGTLKAP
jgi:hypothetical protein